MRAILKNIRMRGLLATVPSSVSYFKDEIKQFPFPEKTSIRLGKVMGFKEHRITDKKTTVCDLASYSLDYLFKKGYLARDRMDAMIVVSQQHDHPLPGNSKVIHGQSKLPRDVHCVDIYENCIGFISGFFTAATMVSSGAVNEVVLITSDAGGCYANIKDRNTYPLVGDAAGVAVITHSDDPDDKFSFVFHHDGSRRGALITPAGGLRLPYSAETAKLYKDEMGNYRSLNNMYMDGTAVFQFVMEEVPPLIDEVCRLAGVTKESIKYHLAHQPNRFMLEKLADLCGVPREIFFNNIVENFGNSSPSTIPVNVAFNLGSRLLKEHFLVCFSAFGAGLSLAAAVGTIGNMDFCELIEHPGKGQIDYGT